MGGFPFCHLLALAAIERARNTASRCLWWVPSTTLEIFSASCFLLLVTLHILRLLRDNPIETTSTCSGNLRRKAPGGERRRQGSDRCLPKSSTARSGHRPRSNS